MSTIIITADSGESDRLFASMVRAMRRSLDATKAQLARASGIGRQRLETIEAGGSTTRAERHHITVALGSLSDNRATQALPSAAPRDDGARLPGAAVRRPPSPSSVPAATLRKVSALPTRVLT